MNGLGSLNIGQDGTGDLQYPLLAAIDELMIFGDVLTNEDLSALARYYEI